MNDIKAIASQFPIEGAPLEWSQIKSGHINETYLVVTSRPHLYILQKLSTQAFKNVPGLMENVIAVTQHLYFGTAAEAAAQRIQTDFQILNWGEIDDGGS